MKKQNNEENRKTSYQMISIALFLCVYLISSFLGKVIIFSYISSFIDEAFPNQVTKYLKKPSEWVYNASIFLYTLGETVLKK